MSPKLKASGTLYLIAIDIGDIDDITFRARRLLAEVDMVVCEERKEGSKLLKRLGIAGQELWQLSEHSREEQAEEILKALSSGKSVGLISDAGTPVLADPGNSLVNRCISEGILMVPVPGPASPLAALVVSGFSLHRWHYAGFLPRERGQRKAALAQLKNLDVTTIVMEAPYRLRVLLEDSLEVLGEDRRVVLCWQLTQEDEEVVRGNLLEVQQQVRANGWKKGEFVLVISGANWK